MWTSTHRLRPHHRLSTGRPRPTPPSTVGPVLPCPTDRPQAVSDPTLGRELPALEELLTDAWLAVAPKRLAAHFLRGHGR